MFRKFGFLLVFSIGKYILIKNESDKPMSRYEWERLMESSYITMPKWYYNISECDRRYDEDCRTIETRKTVDDETRIKNIMAR